MVNVKYTGNYVGVASDPSVFSDFFSNPPQLSSYANNSKVTFAEYNTKVGNMGKVTEY